MRQRTSLCVKKKSIYLITSLTIVGAIVLLLNGCMSNPLSNHKKASIDPRMQADTLANSHGFEKKIIPTQSFLLTSYQKHTLESQPQSNQKKTTQKNSNELTIYIEGDGRSWISRTRLSSDPTPRQPIALKLAIQDPNHKVAYLARPCQYTPIANQPACDPSIWSNRRFSNTVITSMNEAITKLKQKADAQKIHLVGFSGGAAVAILIAERRTDIATLRTVAGDLNPNRLAEYHHTTPLNSNESLNPIEAIPRLTHLPQYHFSGEKDKIVPPFIAIEFVNKINHYHHIKSDHPKLEKQDLKNCAHYQIIPKATHHEGIESIWPTLLQLPVVCSSLEGI